MLFVSYRLAVAHATAFFLLLAPHFPHFRSHIDLPARGGGMR
jgi:hypothetical protein